MKQLKKFPDIHFPMQEEHRGSRHNSRRAPFSPPHLKMKAHFPASSGNESQRSRRTSRGGGLNLKVDRNPSVCATIPNNPEVPVHSRYAKFPCTYLTVTQSIDLQHNSTCDSPGEPREKATEPYVNSTGSLTLLLQHGRKVDLHVSTR